VAAGRVKLCLGTGSSSKAERAYPEPIDAARELDVVMVAESEGGYSVFVPELPSVATQGESIEEVRANAREAIEGYLEVMLEDGLPIPTGSSTVIHRRSAGVRRGQLT
jgi:antitoxin HicB